MAQKLTSITLNEEEVEKLSQWQEQTKRSRSELIRALIRKAILSDLDPE
jgi:metal-responsive CopG/Arc/MetJ family transcriptional regulator